MEIDPNQLVAADPADAAGTRRFLKSNGLSLTVDEYARVCELLGRRPTTVELHIFNTMWSEHCSYKSSRPTLKKYLFTDAPHVVLGPGEDAGIVRFAESPDGKSMCLVMAHESHNHPSQVLPVEGAATGIGGIVRDVYCMGADVIGVMDPLRFGDPGGAHAARARDIAWGVVDGIAQYGNALGVPNYGGDTYFDATYDDNCLVNVVAFGIVEEGRIIRSRVPEEAKNEPYDMILFGKPTDASGFGGAAFASERLSEEEAVERQGAVQVPDPFLKRVLAEAMKDMLRWAYDNRVAIGFKDLGAGGISCAVSEMAAAAGFGVTVDLDSVNVAFDDMLAEVISCSETQERFALAVPSRLSADVVAIFNEHFELPHLYHGAGAYVIGRVTPDKRFRMLQRGKLVCDADVDVITTGIVYERVAEKRQRTLATKGLSHPSGTGGVRETLLILLASENISDKSFIYQHYDSEVQARAVLRPGEADAAVEVFMPGQPQALAASCGGSSRMGVIDPYLGGVWSVLEAVRNVACVGAVPVALTDCLNYGDPEDAGVFWEFSEGVRGIGDACRALKVYPGADHGVPIVSGNVSFYNQSETGNAIAPTPIVACAGRIDDASHARGMGFKAAGSRIVFLGRLHGNLGGSEYERLFDADGSGAPAPDFAMEVGLVRTLVDAFADALVSAAHDVSHGGLLVTIAEMMLASAPFKVGCKLDLRECIGAHSGDVAQLFSEFGGVVAEVTEDAWLAFEKIVDRHGTPYAILGRTTEATGFVAAIPDGGVDLSFADIELAHKGNIASLLMG